MNSLTSNRSPWHWLLVIAVASVLGLGVVFATRLPFSTTVMLLLVLVVPFAVLVAPNIEKIGIVIILLDIPLQIDTFIGFDESQADFGAIIGFNFSITTLALVLLYGHWALTHYRRLVENKPIDSHDLPAAPSHRSQKLLRLAFVLPLVYIAFAALSAAGSTDPMRVVYELCLLLQVYLAVLYLFSHMRTRQEVLFVCGMLVLGVGIAGAISAVLRVTGQGFSFGILNGRVDNDWLGVRVGGTVGTPNTAAGYFAFAMSIAGGLLLAKVSRSLKALSVFGLLFGCIGLVVTSSRGGWITFAIVIAVLLAIGVYRHLVNPAVVIAVLVMLAGVVFVFQGEIVDRITTDDRGSAESRLPLNAMAWKIIQDHPIFGVGLNNYDLAMQDYITPDLSGEWIYIVHNRYLLLWSETGIGGLVAYIALILLGIFGGWHAIKLKDPVLSPIALGAFAGCCGILIHFAADIFSGRNVVELLWLMAGLQLVIWRMVVYENLTNGEVTPERNNYRLLAAPKPNQFGEKREWISKL